MLGYKGTILVEFSAIRNKKSVSKRQRGAKKNKIKKKPHPKRKREQAAKKKNSEVLASCGGTTQINWAWVLRSLLLGNADPKKWHSLVVPRVKSRLKPRFLGSNRQHPHEGEPRDYNTDHFIHLKVAAEI